MSPTASPDWRLRVARRAAPPASRIPDAEDGPADFPVRLYRLRNGWRLEYPDTGTYDVAAGGRRITWYPAADALPELVQADILGRVLALALGLPGSKNACEQGECGSCSVILDGDLVCACLVLAAQADGHEVTTVEGLRTADGLHRVQQAFVEAGAVQCGFCTPGLVVATAALLDRVPNPSDDVIREELSGNLCRCTGYAKIFDAVRLAARR